MKEEEKNEMRKIVKMALIRIGIRCDLIGFSYLCYAVELAIEHPELMKNLCRGMYVEIGKHFEVENISSVERSIRHAIDNTYTLKSFGELNKMYKAFLYTVNDKPTAGELIRLVAEWYLLELYKED